MGFYKEYKGTYYFQTREAAKDWAIQNGWPVDRIIEYRRGYAVQLHISGTYAGPDVEIKNHKCDFCDAK